jgi:Spy/CpxP family protein refolding chaperone
MTESAQRRFLPVAFGFFTLLASGSAYAQPPMAWWKNDSTVKELGLTADQSARLETIFQASMADLRREKADLDNVEGKLSRLIETNADEARVTAQIDRVESARAALNKTRTLMLLHMRQVLAPDQSRRLTAMRDRRDRDSRRPSSGQDRQPKPDTRKDLE